jgi:hypothetical protein
MSGGGVKRCLDSRAQAILRVLAGAEEVRLVVGAVLALADAVKAKAAAIMGKTRKCQA